MLLFDREDPTAAVVIFDDTIEVAVGDIFNLAINDAQVAAEADAGRSLYEEGTLGTNTGCRICHSLDAEVVLVGPSFDGIATRAATRARASPAVHDRSGPWSRGSSSAAGCSSSRSSTSSRWLAVEGRPEATDQVAHTIGAVAVEQLAHDG